MQLWILITVTGHFLNALAATIDKHLVSNTTLKPVAYAFYSGLFQILYLVAIPVIAFLSPETSFGFPSWNLFVLAVADGALFILALLFLYKATENSEVSRVTPIVGTSVPIFTLILSWIFLGQYLTSQQMVAFVLFIIGGFLISANFRNGKIYHIKGLKFAITAGFLFAVYYVIMSFLYTEISFWNVFIILQFGNFVGSICLLISKENRKLIFNPADKKTQKPKSNGVSGLFFIDKIFAATAAILISYAVSIGNVTIIQALQSTQYVFILALAFTLSKKMPQFFQERIEKEILVQKMTAILLVTIGLFLIV
jgi:drug/metabolite transporter (DMT)-like permease